MKDYIKNAMKDYIKKYPGESWADSPGYIICMSQLIYNTVIFIPLRITLRTALLTHTWK